MGNAPHERLTQTWGRNLRAARQAANLSQTEFARLVGMTQTTVSRYERAEAPWTPEVMLSFAVTLERNVGDLFPWWPGIEDAERFRRLTAPKPAEVA